MEQLPIHQKIMLMNRDRVYYYGLLGARMQNRCMGAVSIYLAPVGSIHVRIGDQAWQTRTCVVVPHSVPHQVATNCQRVVNLLIEPERIDPAALEDLGRACNALSTDHEAVARIRLAADSLKGSWGRDGLGTSDFDRLILGRSLPRRDLDPRVDAVLDCFERDFGDNGLSADACAKDVGLSKSRFLHLFKEETGVSFRNLRMWKRARRFLEWANQEGSLTDVALDLGYPDSSHFSHSIRRIYGLKPRSIRNGSRGLQVLSKNPAVHINAAAIAP